ncbi:hypothetical protein BH11PLA1_BH11PLA1_03680 [soil metagenome]
MPAASPFTSVCLRCGYDLAGALDLGDRCPLEVTCPECGVTLQSVAVTTITRYDLPWLFEHAPPWSLGAARFVRTLIHLLWPPHFWRSVTIERRVSVPRLLVTLALFLFIPWCLHAVGHFWCLRVIRLAPANPVLDDAVSALAWPLGPFWRLPLWGEPTLYLREWYPPMLCILGAALLPQLILCVLAESRRLARLRIAHLFRCNVYSLLPLAVALWGAAGREVHMVARFAIGFNPTKFPYNEYESYERVFRNAASTIAALSLIWLVLYWFSALKRGLRLERAATIFILMAIAAMLASMFLVVEFSHVSDLFFT